MECTDIRRYLVRYVDNDLSEDTRSMVAEHLEHCYLCQEELSELDTVLKSCRDLLRHPAPRDRFDELKPRLRPAPVLEPVEFRPRHLLRNLAAAAAAMVLIVGLGDQFSRLLQGVETTIAQASRDENGFVPLEPGKGQPWNLLTWQSHIVWAEKLNAERSEPKEPANNQPPGGVVKEGKDSPDPVSSREGRDAFPGVDRDRKVTECVPQYFFASDRFRVS